MKYSTSENVGENLFVEWKDFNLFTLELHMFDQMLEDIFRFRALNFSDASPFDHFLYVIKDLIKRTSVRLLWSERDCEGDERVSFY